MTALQKRILSAAGAVALAIGISGAASAQTAITVVLPNPSAINVFPLYTAIGEGFFEEEGLTVTVESVDGSSQVLQALSSGQGQIGEPGPGPVLAARGRGEDVVFIYNYNVQSIFGVVVREESEFQEPIDLKGTVIGVGTADGAEVGFTRNILNDAGLVEGTDYEFLPVGDGGLAAAAFERGDISAYAAATSDAAIMGTRGLALREITPEEYLAYFGNGFAAMADYIEANPEVIEGFGRAMVRATEFALDPANREAALAHAREGNPQEGDDTALANSLFDAVSARIQPLDPATPWGYSPPEAWQMWHDAQVATGALEAPLDDVTAAYTNDFVETWNEGAAR
jgi:NitT/TauT family transport system substrate-binding protein